MEMKVVDKSPRALGAVRDVDDEEDMAPPPAEVMDPRRIDWQGRHMVRFGTIRVYRVGKSILFIGPHWYCSLIMLIVIDAVGIFFVSFATTLGPMNVLGGIFVTVATTLMFLRCALANPGILKQHPNRDSESTNKPLQSMQLQGIRACVTCDITPPLHAFHCEYCEVCINGHDHHCPWMSKCVGSGNLEPFYSFLCVGFSSLGYLFLAVIASPNIARD